MMTLKELAEQYGDVWIYCRDESLQERFLSQAEEEGFLTLNGQKPAELRHQILYGIFDDMTMGYLSGMVWCYSARNPGDNHIRVDYEKYLNDESDIFYHIKDSDKQYDLVVMQKETDKETDKEIQAGSKVKYLAETTWAYKKGKIYEVCGYDRELDAWGVMSETGEIYLVGEDDLELVTE